MNRTPGADEFGGYIYFLEGADLHHVRFGGDAISTTDQSCVGIDWDGVKSARLSLAGCRAEDALDSENGSSGQEGDAYGVSTLQLADAPNTRIKCGQEATSLGRINGVRVRCAAKVVQKGPLL